MNTDAGAVCTENELLKVLEGLPSAGLRRYQPGWNLGLGLPASVTQSQEAVAGVESGGSVVALAN